MQHVANLSELRGRAGEAAIEVERLSHVYAGPDGGVPALAGHLHVGRQGPLRGDRRPERLRQDLAADDDGGAAPPDRGHASSATAGRSRSPIPSGVGVIFQEASLFPWLTTLDNIEFPLEPARHAARGAPAPVAGHAEPGRPRGLRRALSARAVGRHEAARLDRARPGAGPAGAADGRAVRRARRADPHDHGP